MSLEKWQAKFFIAGALILPLAPFLYVQGQRTRRRVGVLPNADGGPDGIAGGGEGEPVRLLVMGESTVAGLGARTHEFALAGRFAEQIGKCLSRPVRWHVIGKNGVTARRTIDELVPQMPETEHDYVLLGLGGNDVMRLSSPKKWRRDMLELLDIIRERNPRAAIFLSNCPMINYSPVIPQPIKGILWELSKMHDANIRDFTAGMERVFYYPQPAGVDVDGFFADGIHPSEKGYADWAAAMMSFFNEHCEWRTDLSSKI